MAGLEPLSYDFDPPDSISHVEEDAWIRLPDESERCKISGLSRTGLSELLEEADPVTGEKFVLSLRKKKPGANRAVRLINKASLLAYLDRIAQSQRGCRLDPSVPNPHEYSVEEILTDFELFQLFIGPDNIITSKDWDVGKLASRRSRLIALLSVGVLVQTDPKEK